MAKALGKDITDQQAAFCQQYVANGFKPKDAALSAGYSAKSASSLASQLLNNPKIQAEIARITKKAGRRLEVTAERVIEELARIGFADFRSVASFDENGVRIKASSDLSDDEAATIKQIKETFSEGPQTSSRTLTVIQHDKTKALELLGKHLGCWKDKDDSDGSIHIHLGYDPDSDD